MRQFFYRGDARKPKVVFEEGFKKRHFFKSAEKNYLPFISSNAISLSSELGAAAAFPLKEEKETYVYFVRNGKDGYYNLYGESLKESYLFSPYRDIEMSEDISRLAWANEYVSEKNIKSSDIIGGIRIHRKFSGHREFDNPSSLFSFQVMEYYPNPKFKSKLTTVEATLIKLIKKYISEGTVLPSKAPKKSEARFITESSQFFYQLYEKNLGAITGGLDIVTLEMVYAASKAKIFSKGNQGRKDMQEFLSILFNKVKNNRCSNLLYSTLNCRYKENLKVIQEFFLGNKIYDEKSIHTMNPERIEKLFFSLEKLWQRRKLSKYFGEDLNAELLRIIKDYHEISKIEFPQLAMSEAKDMRHVISG